jgi:DNA-binding response OmpR family regulator
VRRGGRARGLAAKEFGVLEALMLADGEVLSAEVLLARVWTRTLTRSRPPCA